MHKIPVLTLLLITSALGASSRQERMVRIFSRYAVPGYAGFICPCEFDLGDAVDDETGLIVNHNAEGQPAFVSIDGSIVRLERSAAFRFRCDPNEAVQGSWRARGIDLQVKLTCEGPGEEACFFRGVLRATKGSRTEARRIVGGCGC